MTLWLWLSATFCNWNCDSTVAQLWHTVQNMFAFRARQLGLHQRGARRLDWFPAMGLQSRLRKNDEKRENSVHIMTKSWPFMNVYDTYLKTRSLKILLGLTNQIGICPQKSQFGHFHQAGLMLQRFHHMYVMCSATKVHSYIFPGKKSGGVILLRGSWQKSLTLYQTLRYVSNLQH